MSTSTQRDGVFYSKQIVHSYHVKAGRIVGRNTPPSLHIFNSPLLCLTSPSAGSLRGSWEARNFNNYPCHVPVCGQDIIRYIDNVCDCLMSKGRSRSIWFRGLFDRSFSVPHTHVGSLWKMTFYIRNSMILTHPILLDIGPTNAL